MSNLGLLGWKVVHHNNWRVFRDKLQARTPELLQVGRAPPKCVISFGGAGCLVTYSLGVAAYLHREKQSLLASSFILGAGSGSIAAAALACGAAVSFETIRDMVIDRAYSANDHPTHVAAMKQGISALLPRNAHELMNGRVAIALGPSNRDVAFYEQPAQQRQNGWHICSWRDADDVGECLIAASNGSTTTPYTYRECPCFRATFSCLSSELDQFVRHVHIHGFAGFPNQASHQKHRVFIDRHGFLSYTGQPPVFQFLAAAAPAAPIASTWAKDVLRSAFDAGFHDARRYERWEEDAYFYAKPDRSPSKEKNWSQFRASFFKSSAQTTL